MNGQKPREPRRVVILTCRMRHDTGWADLTICNLSSRGLMAKCTDPPQRGAFVEVRRGAVSIVGQVRWAYGGHIGIRTQEPIDIPGLLGDGSATERPAIRERRLEPRGDNRDPQSQAGMLEERSRRWAHLFDWLVVAAVGIAAAGLLAEQVHSVLSAPLAQVAAALPD